MRKGFRTSLLIAIVAAAGTLAGCGTSVEPSANNQTTETALESIAEKKDSESELAAKHLLTVWSDYLTILDQMYASELWAFGYVEAYLESGDWADLTKARTACIASARYLTELSMTEEDLSEEEYLCLTNAGIDTGYQLITFSSLADALDGAHSFVRNRLLENLEYHIFYKNVIDNLKEEIAVEREAIFCMCRYNYIETNYLLLSLGKIIDTNDYWSSMQDKYPALSSGYSEWLNTKAELKLAGDLCLDEYEENLLRKSDVISGLSADLYDMKQIVQNRDLDSLITLAYPMTNLPDLLPLPVWYDPEKTGYLSFIREGEESISYPESGDELLDADYGMYIQVQEIGKEEIEEYLAFAENFSELIWKEEEKDTWYISMPTYHVQIEWKDEIATFLFLGEDITFAPSWYIWR